MTRLLLAVSILACIVRPVSVRADIGNLGWAEGAERVRASGSSSPWVMRVTLEPSYGKAKSTRRAGTSEFKSEEDYAAVLLGVVVPVHRMAVGQAELDLSLLAAAGPELVGIDRDGWGLLGLAGPEVGVVVNAKSSISLRVLGGVAAGTARALASGAPHDLDFLLSPRVGAELGAQGFPLNLAGGVRWHRRGDQPSSFGTLTRNDRVLYLSLRVRVL